VSAEILLHDGVGTFALAIGFGVEGSAEAAINAEAITQSAPKSGGELGTPVGDDADRQSMKAEHMLQEHIGQILSIDVVATWDKVPAFRQAVNYHPYSVVTL
jgi:hypothetical protein